MDWNVRMSAYRLLLTILMLSLPTAGCVEPEEPDDSFSETDTEGSSDGLEGYGEEFWWWGSSAEDNADEEALENAGEQVIQLDEGDLFGMTSTHNSDEHFLTFNAPSETIRGLQVGNIIVSGDEENPFIREILHQEFRGGDSTRETAEQIWLWTEDLTIAEVAPEVFVNHVIELPVLEKDISGQVIAENWVGNIVCSDCFVRFSPSFEMGVEMKNSRLEAFSGNLNALLQGSLEITATMSGNKELKGEVELASVSQRLVQNIGPIPIWEDVKVSIVLGAKGKISGEASITAGMEAERNLSAGIAYEGGRWRFTEDGDGGELTFEQPLLSTEVGGDAEVYIKGKVEIRVYSIAGAWVSAESRGRVEAQVCPSPGHWSGNGSVNVKVGAGIDAFGIFRWQREEEIFSSEFKQEGELPDWIECP